MSNLKISAVSSLDTIQLQKILLSQKFTDEQKVQFIRKNSVEIRELMKTEISKTELEVIMQDRPLIRFRPLKNSFTKSGDKILLSKALNITPQEVNGYVQKMVNSINLTNTDNYSADEIEKVKTYVYRHGTKTQVITFLKHELSDVEMTLFNLYKTLEYNSGGLADYFSRPIHRMDNSTLSKLYNVIDKSLAVANKSGVISEDKLNSTSKWALVKIYEIQNNSKVIRAINLYKKLK